MRSVKVLLSGAVAAAVLTAGTLAFAKTVNLRLSYWVSPSHMLSPGYKDWASALDKASGGTIRTTLFPSSQLGSGADHYDMVRRGIADVGLISPGYTAGRFPVIAAVDLPFLVSDSNKAAPAIQRWYSKYAEKEMADHIVCAIVLHEPGTFHSAKREIRVPNDLKGLNVRSANQTIGTLITSSGGNAVQVPIMEAYDTLKRGITDAITIPWDNLTHPAFKFSEVTTYTLDIPVYVSAFTHGISRKSYNALSPEQRKAVDSVCTPEWSAKIQAHWYQDAMKRMKDIRASDRKLSKISEDELRLWREAAKPIYEAWSLSVKNAGYDPDVVLNELKDELKKAGALYGS